MLSDSIYIILKKCAWVLFFVLLVLSLANLVLAISENVIEKSLPFKHESGVVTKTTDDALDEIFKNKIITKIDTLEISPSIIETGNTEEDDESVIEQRFIFRSEASHGIQFSYTPDFQLVNKDSVEIVLKDTLTGISESRFIQTNSKYNKWGILNLAGNLALIIFAFFNSFLLLKYSSAKENILIVFFVLFLITPSPSLILGKSLLYVWMILLSPFWGILFYHYMVLKAGVKKKIKKLYVISTIIFLISYVVSLLIKESFDFIHLWSAFWMFKGFLLLRREYKKSRSIELRRLWGAFGGIGISMISIIMIFVVAFIIALFAGISSLTGLSMMIKSYSEFLGIIIAILVLIPILGVFIGFIWFLGSFTWSLLTGTAMGVKIRSTLIYTITGVVFVIVFGLVDYSLGEILQSLFGKFVGSEFIAGIPITIGMIALFNPVRGKIEKLVDGKLNTSELDFLEKTETFTHNISEEGVLEGFEEYICENLLQRLKLTKVALVSYDNDMKAYKFNEIRGSDVIENSKVDDVHLLLLENKIQKNNGAVNEDPQEISSFPMIIPIIHDLDHKWFLALGKKSDKSLYSKKDEQALIQLTERIKLSLKFILAYEEIVNKKYHQTITKHQDVIKEKDEVIRMLKKELKEISI
ncbi:MAG: hypothetical protein KAS53_10720 [Candidatus Cloacimonetes bacterium]|nr:hypothetical protein [Candidatus Cloacimonadota bacterium]